MSTKGGAYNCSTGAITALRASIMESTEFDSESVDSFSNSGASGNSIGEREDFVIPLRIDLKYVGEKIGSFCRQDFKKSKSQNEKKQGRISQGQGQLCKNCPKNAKKMLYQPTD